MAVLLCPLCSQSRFDNLETLRHRLIHAATQNISCPLCSEVLVGLDKLTIHLFGHTVVEESASQPCQTNQVQFNVHEEEKGAIKQNEPTSPQVDIDLLFDITRSDRISTDTPKVAAENSSCTVNLEDLSFLTSWEGDVKCRQKNFKEDDPATPSNIHLLNSDSNNSDTCKEGNAELSEYMSELLNKKLPISNFLFNDRIQTDSAVKVEQDCVEKVNCETCGLYFPSQLIKDMHVELTHANLVKEESNITDGNKHVAEEKINCEVKPVEISRVPHFGLNLPADIPVFNNSATSPSDDRQYLCNICPKSFKKEQHLTQHLKTHEGKQWQCETCNKHFTTKYFLKKHQRLHTGEMPYCCSTCGKTFTFQQSYHKHLLYHSDDKPHECAECGRCFKELSTLHNHQRIHSGEKPFSCQVCGKCFRQRVSYIVHQRIHTGVLPYQCTACKKKFRYKVSQRSHKCTAQPPGVVIRQTSDLIQRILEHRNNILQSSVQE